MKIVTINRYISHLDIFKKPKASYLGKGESNDNFLITDGNKKYVLRKNQDKVLSENRLKNKYIALRFLEKEGINFVPKSIFYDPKERIHIISYVEGRKVKLKNLNEKQLKIFSSS